MNERAAGRQVLVAGRFNYTSLAAAAAAAVAAAARTVSCCRRPSQHTGIDPRLQSHCFVEGSSSITEPVSQTAKFFCVRRCRPPSVPPALCRYRGGRGQFGQRPGSSFYLAVFRQLPPRRLPRR